MSMPAPDESADRTPDAGGRPAPHPAARPGDRPAALLLAGGAASRMGAPKSLLRIGEEFVLARLVAVLREVADPVAIVAGPDVPLPDASVLAGAGADVPVLRDRPGFLGPLEGFRAGLAWLTE